MFVIPVMMGFMLRLDLVWLVGRIALHATLLIVWHVRICSMFLHQRVGLVGRVASAATQPDVFNATLDTVFSTMHQVLHLSCATHAL